jgi:hypothetical protein
MSAKTELFDRLKYLDSAIKLPSMIDIGIAPCEHNGVANLLRKGLGIVAFNILEDFIRNKSLESLATVSNSRISFDKLTESLQEASITGALSALSFRSKIEKNDGGDWKTLVQDEALKIHSTKYATFELSKFSLVSANSNINAAEVADVLKSFGIKGGWNTLKQVSDNVGGGLPDLNQSYKNAADRRHASAHTATFQYNYQWLSDIRNEILAISCSLEILLSARCRQIATDLTKNIADHDINDALNYRFLEQSGAVYRETTQIGGRARKKWLSLVEAINHIQPHLSAKNEYLVVLNNTRRIDDWYV